MSGFSDYTVCMKFVYRYSNTNKCWDEIGYNEYYIIRSVPYLYSKYRKFGGVWLKFN